jgi:hypothetical protein
VNEGIQITQPADANDDPSNDSQDFELSHRDVIHEDNWPDYEAQGFVAVPYDFSSAKTLFGTENVYSGDAFDPTELRPLRHKPGASVYTNRAGLEHWKKISDEWGLNHSRPGDSAAS